MAQDLSIRLPYSSRVVVHQMNSDAFQKSSVKLQNIMKVSQGIMEKLLFIVLPSSSRFKTTERPA